MKKQIFFTTLLLLGLTTNSCSSDDSQQPDPTPDFAMTAKINGVDFQANNPFDTNEFSNTNIFTRYPLSDYVLIQGRQGGLLGTPEINIWLKLTDIVLGTYIIGQETFTTPLSHFIDLTDNSNSIFEYTKNGTITIDEVNTTNNTVKGTFEFTTVDDINDPSAPIDYTISEGTFFYIYQ